MDHTVEGKGVGKGVRNDVKNAVLGVMNQLGIGYDFVTFSWSNDDVEVVHLHDGSPAPEGISSIINLPPVEQTLPIWGELLQRISNACPDFMVTMPVDGVVQAAINGNVL